MESVAEIRSKIPTIVDRIVKAYKPLKVILFGSYAWGEPTRDSDVDLFIIKNEIGRKIDEMTVVQGIVHGDLAADTLVYSEADTARRVSWGDFFIRDIIQKGIYLYGDK